MNYNDDTFVRDIFGTLSVIAKIILTIILKVNALLNVNVLLIILICIGCFMIPFGGTIIFIACKLTGTLLLSWKWIILAIILDGMTLPTVVNAFKNPTTY